ncbi:MAG TPA: ATP-binding cassette domain-containing protein [Propionibacteriaceae bacterium]|nr:ATP-binding cassette domain-containing protein [Propionibacteriaceae bacterium]
MNPTVEAAPVDAGAVAFPVTLPEDSAVATNGLTKAFSGKTVVDHIDLRVPRGAVYGFLGPNGSGKTTTIRMLLGLARPTSGTVQLLGRSYPDAVESLHRVGALVEGPAFHNHLSGRANLARIDAADARSDPRTSRARIDRALDRVGLLPAATKRFRIYSLGMKQRLAIAATLLMPRDLLVLDEPTNGLDPQGTREVRQLVGSLCDDGVTVLVSSHLLSEVEQMCSHVGVMSAGRLVAQGRLDELAAGRRRTVTVRTPDAGEAASVLTRLGLAEVTASGGRVTAVPGEQRPEEVVAELVRSGVRVQGFADEHERLEDIFVGLTGEGFDVRG